MASCVLWICSIECIETKKFLRPFCEIFAGGIIFAGKYARIQEIIYRVYHE